MLRTHRRRLYNLVKTHLDNIFQIPRRGYWFHLKRRFTATGQAILESLGYDYTSPPEEYKNIRNIRNDQYRTNYIQYEFSDVNASLPPAHRRKSLSAIAAAERRKSVTMYENKYGMGST